MSVKVSSPTCRKLVDPVGQMLQDVTARRVSRLPMSTDVEVT